MPRVLTRAVFWPCNPAEESKDIASAHFRKETSCSYVPHSTSHVPSSARGVHPEVLVASLVVGCVAVGLIASAAIFYFVRSRQRHALEKQEQQHNNRSLPTEAKATPRLRTCLAEGCHNAWLDLAHRCRARLPQHTSWHARRVSSTYECKTSRAIDALSSSYDPQQVKMLAQPDPIQVADTIQPQGHQTPAVCCGTSSLYSNQTDRCSALTLFEEYLLSSPSSPAMVTPTLEEVVVRLEFAPSQAIQM